MLSEQISIVSGRSGTATKNGIDSYYSMSQQTSSRSSGKAFESPYTLSTIADPYIRNIDKQLYLKNNYKQMMGKNAPITKLMKSTGMQPQTEQYLAQRLNGADARFTNEDIRSFSDMVWKNMNGFSRFFAQGRINPADVHVSDSQRFFQQTDVKFDGIAGNANAADISNAFFKDVFGDAQQRQMGKDPDDEIQREKEGTGFGSYLDSFADAQRQTPNPAAFTPQQQQQQASLMGGDGQNTPQPAQHQDTPTPRDPLESLNPLNIPSTPSDDNDISEYMRVN